MRLSYGDLTRKLEQTAQMQTQVMRIHKNISVTFIILVLMKLI
jgi:hypothetical protein